MSYKTLQTLKKLHKASINIDYYIEDDCDGFADDFSKATHEASLLLRKEPWKQNSIQFPRLLAEIVATGAVTNEVMHELCDSMDLSKDEVDELFDRAQKDWEKLKEMNCPIDTQPHS